jgi:hypothetical protein
VDVVAIVALGRSIDDEAPRLASDLGLTAYETAVMLRAPAPVIVFRSEDRARTLDVLGKLQGRGHDAVACDLDDVVSSAAMFQPKSFRFDGEDMVGHGHGEEQRLALGDVFALVRATHVTQTEEVATKTETKLSLGRAALTGGLLATKSKKTETSRVAEDREPVLYVFRGSAAPWLLRSTVMRYDGLGPQMRVSKSENFEVLVRTLRELAPGATFDTRLLASRAWATTFLTASAKHISASSSATIDILAHIVATALSRTVRPYR